MWKKSLMILFNYFSGWLILLGILGVIAAFISKPISVGGVVGGTIVIVFGFLCVGNEE
jgi:membrane-bound ClpP family serine protease